MVSLSLAGDIQAVYGDATPSCDPKLRSRKPGSSVGTGAPAATAASFRRFLCGVHA